MFDFTSGSMRHDGEKDCERLAVVVSGENFSKILGIPKIPDGTGRQQAEHVMALLSKWKITEKIVALSFDTTASNTGDTQIDFSFHLFSNFISVTIGIRNGACHLIEQLLGRNLINTACRHHMYELIAEITFKIYFGNTTAPEPALFVKFRKSWDAIDVKCAKPIEDKRLRGQLGNQLVQENLQFLENLLESGEHFPRDDYKECAELCQLILGGRPVNDYRFKVCGACHHARWMSKVTFCFKIYLFR